MKKTLKFLLSLTAFSMVVGTGVALATGFDGNQIAKQTDAATENKDCITFTLEDQVGGTSDGRNPILHFWDITVDSSMGYAASPGADLTAAGFVNDLETGSTAGSNAFDGTNADSGFIWASESGGKRYWTIRLPWYVTGCQFTIKHGDYWSHTNLTVSGSGSYMIYMFNYWSYTELSLGAKGSSGESHVQQVEKYAISATANPSVGGTATVKGNGGSAVASGNYFKRQKITAKATANTGYTFSSWSDSGTAEHTFYASKDVALTANFTANTYNVYPGTLVNCTCSVASTGTFNSNLSITLTKGSQTGYSYSDSISYTIKNGNNTLTSGTATSGTAFNYKMTGTYYSSITIDATCTKTAIPYSITYSNLKGATHSNPESYTIETPTITLANPSTVTGWSFDGWYDAETGGNKVTSITQGSTGDKVLYAHWTETAQVTITFNVLNEFYASVSGIPGATYVTPDDPVVAGYTFNGWIDKPDVIPQTATTVNANMTPKKDTNYTVYHLLEDLSGGGYTHGAIEYKNGTTGSEVTAVARSFHGFTAPSPMPKGIIKGDGSLVLNAYYTRNIHTLTWDFAGGTTTSGENDYTHGSVKYETTIIQPNTPTKTGYTFDGWSRTVPTTMPDSNVTITAEWKANQYTVTLDDNGGTGGQGTVGATYGSNIENVDVPTNYDKTFQGYFDAQSGGTKYIDSNGAGVKAWDKASNTTLYAQWTIEDGKYIHVFGTNERYIKMSINGSSTTEYLSTVSLAKGETFKITSLDSGVESGWYGFSNLKYDTGDGPHVDARSTAQIIDDGTNDHNMKANLAGTNTYTVYFDTKSSKIDDQDGFHTYIPSIVNVEFDLNGKTGTGPDNQIVNARGLVTEPEDPEAIGYSFEGWYSDAACTQAWDFSTYQVVYFSKDDTTHVCTQKLYAKWISTASYDIELNKNGGTGGANVIEDVKVGDEISLTKEELPTKLNNSFTGYFTSGGTQVIDKDGNNVVPYEESFGTTLNAGWQINSGTYLAFSSEEMARDGSHPMSQNGDKTDEFVIKNVSLSKNDYFKVYYVDDYGNVKWQGDGGEGDPTVITTHPYYTAVIDGSKNVKITTDNDTALTYDLYFNTTTRTYTVQYTGVPTAGFYVVKNGDTSVVGLSDKRATEWPGWTGTEYKVTVSFDEGDLLSLYHQSSSDVGEYNPILNESVNVWETDTTTGKLVCPASGTYTFYIITKDGGINYNYVSIFKEGEAEAIEFARAFNTAIGSVCKMDGSTDLGKLNDTWTAQATAFESLTPEAARTLLSKVSATDANKDLKAFAEKYDYVYSMRGSGLTAGNFVGRNVTPVAALHFNGLFTDITNGASSPTLIVIIASIGACILVGGYFLLRRRKED